MKNSFVIVSFFFVFFSCADKKEQWLQQYAKTKCAYQTEKGRLTKDSVDQIPRLISDKKIMEQQFTTICLPYEQKINALKAKIAETEREYLKRSKKAQDEQSLKYGHVSTPAYEKKLRELEDWRASRLLPLQKQAEEINTEMKTLTDYLLIIEKLKKQEEKIKTVYDSIVDVHKPAIDSLQEVLNSENTNFKYLNNELSQEDQQLITRKRDSIRINPCGQ